MEHRIKQNPLLGWHFAHSHEENGYACTNPEYGPRRRIREGTIISVPRTPELCTYGPHASLRPRDALQYAHGPWVSRVQCWGQVSMASDKFAAQKRQHLRVLDATAVLHEYALWLAEQAIAFYERRALHKDSMAPYRAGLEAKRAFLRGERDTSQLKDARWDLRFQHIRTMHLCIGGAMEPEAYRAARRTAYHFEEHWLGRDEQNAELERRLDALRLSVPAEVAS